MFQTINGQVKRSCPETYFDDSNLPSGVADAETLTSCDLLHEKKSATRLRKMQTCGELGSKSPISEKTTFSILYDSATKRQRLSTCDSFASSGVSTATGLSTFDSSQESTLNCHEALDINCEEVLNDDDLLNGFDDGDSKDIDEESDDGFSRASLDSLDRTLMTDEDLELDNFNSLEKEIDNQIDSVLNRNVVDISIDDLKFDNGEVGRVQNEDENELVEASIEYTFHDSTYQHFIQKENDARPSSTSLEVNQSQLNWSMRVILLQWLVEVCAEMGLKRDTFHMCTHYIDSYLSLHKDLVREKFQLLGATSLLIAAKVEEVYAPKVEHITHSTSNAYTRSEITEMEMNILMTLGWDTTPVTLNTWCHWFMRSWDFFYQSTSSGLSLHESFRGAQETAIEMDGTEGQAESADNFTSLLFKNPDANSYKRFRMAMQVIDTILLDHDHLAINNYRVVVLATIYCILAKELNLIRDEAIPSFANDSTLLIYSTHVFNSTFRDFIDFAADLTLEDLLSAISYVMPFITMPFDFHPPKLTHIKQEEIENHYEEFLSYQTYSAHSIQHLNEVHKGR